MSIQDKFKTKGDLYHYLTHQCKNIISHITTLFSIGKYWLPTEKTCRNTFLQAIVEGKKKAIHCRDIEPRRISDSWPEWAVKNVYPLVKDNVAIR